MSRSLAPADYQAFQRLPAIDDAGGEDDEGEVHGVAAMDTAEQLTHQDVQQLALGLGLAGLPLVLWAQSVPLSCVYLEPKEVYWPSKKCADIEGKEELRMQDFCMKSCMKQSKMLFVAFLCLALALQAFVVIMNHGKCANFLRLSFSVDFQKQTEDLQRALDNAEANEGNNSSWWKSVKRFFKQSFINAIMSMREACSKSSTRRFLLAPRILIRFSQMYLVGALGMIGMLVANNLSLYPILLECGHEVLRLRYQHSWYHLSGHGVACLILIAVVLLQFTASFTVQLRLIKDDKTMCDTDIISKLKAQFKQCKDGLFLKKNLTLDMNLAHFKQGLQKNYLRQLESIEHDGYIDNPDTALSCHSWTGPVTLHFKLRKPLVWPFAENLHRIAAITSCFWTALCLVGSSQLCWLCVHSIKTNKQISDFQMQIYLSMMGACGRHSPIGIGSFLGAFLLFAAFIMQIILWKFTDSQAIGSNTSGCYSACLKVVREKYAHEFASQQLWVRIFSATLSDVILDMRVYEKADVKQQDIPEIWCYVWVTLTQSGPDQEEKEDVQNVDASAGRNNRTQWRKSKQPRKVKLEKPPPDNNLEEWLTGLVRDEYGIPVLPVTVLDEKGHPKEKQMIPLQFVAGGPSVWLNLGRKHSWDKLSGAFAFTAFVIVLAEILFSFFYSHATMLSSCDDVLNTQCMYYTINAKQEEHPVTFRRTLGAWTAIAGCVLSMFSCMCIRAANQADAGQVTAGCSGCVCAYMRALAFILVKIWDVVRFLFKSSIDHIYAICRKTCCPVKQRAEAADKLLASGTSSGSTLHA